MDELMEYKIFGILDAVIERAQESREAYAEARDRLELGKLVAYCDVLHDFLDYFDIEENVQRRIGERPEDRFLR
ncbi:MAG TPA: hypothetical protein IAC36_10190 [Candidatus Aphodomonas merdavium]|nr:hypothetical protein [Candidatus Aphodomonas merdavium]